MPADLALHFNNASSQAREGSGVGEVPVIEPLASRLGKKLHDQAEFLAARAVTVHFDGLLALDNVSFHLHKNEILGLIGPNGAGKTTLVNVLTGFQRVGFGSVFLGLTE